MDPIDLSTLLRQAGFMRGHFRECLEKLQQLDENAYNLFEVIIRTKAQTLGFDISKLNKSDGPEPTSPR